MSDLPPELRDRVLTELHQYDVRILKGSIPSLVAAFEKSVLTNGSRPERRL
eukprot:gene31193-6340_t